MQPHEGNPVGTTPPQADGGEFLANLAQTHVAKWSELRPLPVTHDDDLPVEVRDVIAARKIFSAVTAKGQPETTVAGGVEGQNFSMSFIVAPPNNGPSLHRHEATVETFTCLKGRFEMRWGSRGEYHAELTPYDVLVVPPGVERAFTNISDEDGILQVIITGGLHDKMDIAFPVATSEKLKQFGDKYLDYYKNLGFRFDEEPANG